jgi:hypothetical protein
MVEKFPTPGLLRKGRQAAFPMTLLALAFFAPPAYAAPLTQCGKSSVIKGRLNLDPGVSWYQVARCLRSLRNIWARDGADAPVVVTGFRGAPVAAVVRELVDTVAARPTTGVSAGQSANYQAFSSLRGDMSKGARLADLNDKGVPYNAMAQTSFAYTLYSIAAIAEASKPSDAAYYKKLAYGSLNTVLAPTSAGGLRQITRCAVRSGLNCSWYHSVTRRDRRTGQGATLNQHLHAVRDMGMISDLARRQGWTIDLPLEEAVQQGIDQLFLSAGHDGPGKAPRLADFVSAGDRPAIAFYGLDPTANKSQGVYFLPNATKTCGYHLHVLDLLTAVLKRAEKLQENSASLSRAFQCNSAIVPMYRGAIDAKSEKKLAAGRSCPAFSGYDFDKGTSAYFDSKLKSCGISSK